MDGERSGTVKGSGSIRRTKPPASRLSKGLGKVRRNPCCRNLLIGGAFFESHMASVHDSTCTCGESQAPDDR